jgi:nucleotide-binding universal stress UspA family protein
MKPEEDHVMKTILVPTSGSSTDESVFKTALAVARPLAAHLGFYHVRLTTGEAASRAPHVAFCVGSGLTSALAYLHEEEDLLAAAAAAHFKDFCKSQSVAVRSAPGFAETVTASWCEEIDSPASRLMFHARHSDLIVLARPHHIDYMPSMLIEDLLIGSGRPMVIAADSAPNGAMDTIVVGWKETPEAARALAAALPLLERAKKVVLASVTEGDSVVPQTLKHLAWQLAWHGISAESRVIEGKGSDAAALLSQVAADIHADLLVIGGYGHRPLREFVFGGVTRSLIENAKLPVFILH